MVQTCSRFQTLQSYCIKGKLCGRFSYAIMQIFMKLHTKKIANYSGTPIVRTPFRTGKCQERGHLISGLLHYNTYKCNINTIL